MTATKKTTTKKTAAKSAKPADACEALIEFTKLSMLGVPLEEAFQRAGWTKVEEPAPSKVDARRVDNPGWIKLEELLSSETDVLDDDGDDGADQADLITEKMADAQRRSDEFAKIIREHPAVKAHPDLRHAIFEHTRAVLDVMMHV
jgi:hypothetical protein